MDIVESHVRDWHSNSNLHMQYFVLGCLQEVLLISRAKSDDDNSQWLINQMLSPMKKSKKKKIAQCGKDKNFLSLEFFS